MSESPLPPPPGPVKEPTMYCRKCLYVLDGLPVNRCPECGTAFDPSYPRSYLSEPKKHYKLANTSLWMSGTSVFLSPIAGGVFHNTESEEAQIAAFFIGLVLTLLCLASIVVALAAARKAGAKGDRIWLAVLLAVATILLNYYTFQPSMR